MIYSVKIKVEYGCVLCPVTPYENVLGLLPDVRVVGHVNILKGGFVSELSEFPGIN